MPYKPEEVNFFFHLQVIIQNKQGSFLARGPESRIRLQSVLCFWTKITICIFNALSIRRQSLMQIVCVSVCVCGGG